MRSFSFVLALSLEEGVLPRAGEYGTVVEDLLSINEALGLVPSAMINNQTNKYIIKKYQQMRAIDNIYSPGVFLSQKS